MLTNNDHILDFSESPEWLKGIKLGTNEFMLQCYFKKNPQITHLSFFSCGLKNKDLEVICKILQKCPHIQSLDLANNHDFTDDGTDILVKMLPKMHLTELDFSGNYKVSLPAICRLMETIKNTKIYSLKLNRIMLHDGCYELFQALQESTITHLEINTTGLESSDMHMIAEKITRCPHLRSLDISSNLLTDEDIKIITHQLANSNLRKLNVAYNQHTSVLLSSLVPDVRDTTLTELNYDGIPLPSEPLKFIDEAVSFNQVYNCAKRLSLAFRQGEALNQLDTDSVLPTEMADAIGSTSTESQTQKRVFLEGWQARLNTRLVKVAQDDVSDEPARANEYTP